MQSKPGRATSFSEKRSTVVTVSAALSTVRLYELDSAKSQTPAPRGRAAGAPEAALPPGAWRGQGSWGPQCLLGARPGEGGGLAGGLWGLESGWGPWCVWMGPCRNVLSARAEREDDEGKDGDTQASGPRLESRGQARPRRRRDHPGGGTARPPRGVTTFTPCTQKYERRALGMGDGGPGRSRKAPREGAGHTMAKGPRGLRDS